MSSKYKFADIDGIYFITSTVVDWIDVFTQAMVRDTRIILINVVSSTNPVGKLKNLFLEKLVSCATNQGFRALHVTSEDACANKGGYRGQKQFIQII